MLFSLAVTIVAEMNPFSENPYQAPQAVVVKPSQIPWRIASLVFVFAAYAVPFVLDEPLRIPVVIALCTVAWVVIFLAP